MFSIVISISGFAQEKLKEGNIKINHRIYSVSEMDGPVANTKKSYWIENNAEFIKTQKENTKPWANLNNYEFMGSVTFSSVVIKVLGKSRIAELSADKGIVVVTLYPDHTGKIRASTFMKQSTQTVTLKELAKINDYIIDNLSYKVPNDINPGQNITPLTYVIRFSRLNNYR